VNNAEPKFTPPTLLTEAHDGSAFNSGERDLDDWLRQRALQNLRNAASRTYVVCPIGSSKIAGYFALSMGQILAQDVPGAMRRNMPRHIPAVVLARLAIDRTWQGQGLGRAMLSDVTRRAQLAASEVAARVIIVHAISPAAEAFYVHHGFTRLPVDAPTLALDLLKLWELPATPSAPIAPPLPPCPPPGRNS
jgi:GNAT superfamily N-acetyltransferase